MQDNVKTKIVKSATQLFLSNGYQGVSIREISILSGISNTYVHKLFGSKQALFHSVVKYHDDKLNDYLTEQIKLGTPPLSIVSLLFESQTGATFCRLMVMSAFTDLGSEMGRKYLENNPNNSFLKVQSLLLDDIGVPPYVAYMMLNNMFFGPVVMGSKYLESLGFENQEIQTLRKSTVAHMIGFLAQFALNKSVGCVGESNG